MEVGENFTSNLQGYYLGSIGLHVIDENQGMDDIYSRINKVGSINENSPL